MFLFKFRYCTEAGADGAASGGAPESSSLLDAATQPAANAQQSAGEPQGQPTTTEQSKWFLAEGVEGTGDKPEFLKPKYKTLADQAKAYTELEKRFGAFAGAPDGDYELSVPEGLDGISIDTNDPLLKNVSKIAKDMNMSQEGFTTLVHAFMQSEAEIIRSEQVSLKNELEQLGENANARIIDTTDWLKANLDEANFNTVKGLITNAAAFQAIEALIGQKKAPVIPGDGAHDSGQPSASELQARFADPRQKTDPAFRAETTKLFERVYGTQPAKQIIG